MKELISRFAQPLFTQCNIFSVQVRISSLNMRDIIIYVARWWQKYPRNIASLNILIHKLFGNSYTIFLHLIASQFYNKILKYFINFIKLFHDCRFNYLGNGHKIIFSQKVSEKPSLQNVQLRNVKTVWICGSSSVFYYLFWISIFANCVRLNGKIIFFYE